MSLLAPNRHRGKLIVVEGIDGSGKSTQISLLSHWLRSQGYAVAFSEWNSSPLVRQTTRRGKKKEMFTPTTFSLIHATDFADRMESYILPLVKAGAIVCADRYAYTAFARDVARGVGPQLGAQPLPLRHASQSGFLFPRAAGRGARAAFWAAATRSSITKPAWTWDSAATSRRASASSRAASWTSTKPWRRRWASTSSTPPYPSKSSSGRCGDIVMDATGREPQNQRSARCPREENSMRQPTARSQFYSEPLPGVDRSELQGKLIVIEGPDAVGRSTQIAQLRQWLEQEGHAVLDTGMARSALAGKGIKEAKEGNTLGPDHDDPVLHHRFRRPPGERDHSRAARRLRGADRPLHLFDHGARHRARRGPPLDRTGRRLRAGAARRLLSARRSQSTWFRAWCWAAARSIIGKAAWTCASAATCTRASCATRRG